MKKEKVNITAFIGRDYGFGEHTTSHVMNTTLNALMSYGINGATFSEAVGIWQGESENSVRVELLGVDEHAAHMALKAACCALMQWEIVYTVNGQGMKSVKDNAEMRRAARMNRAA